MNVDIVKMTKAQKDHLVKIVGKADFSGEELIAAIDKINADKAAAEAKKKAEQKAFYTDTIEIGYPRAADITLNHYVLDVPSKGSVTLSFHHFYLDRIELGLEASFESKTWDIIESDVQKKLSSLLRESGKNDGKISVGKNRMHFILGQQVVVLAWALEGVEDETEIEIITAFWRRISESDRSFLYYQGSAGKTDLSVFKQKLTDVFKTGTAKIDLNDFI